MRRLTAWTLLVVFTLVPSAARADHVPPDAGVVPLRLGAPPTWLSEGPIRFIGNAQAGRAFSGPLGEVQPFERNGRRYLVAGSSVYGFSVVDVTNPLEPSVVSEYSSAFGCPTSAAEGVAALNSDQPVDYALGYGGWENDVSFAPDGRWVALGMDAPGRCHDPGGGGLEIVDLSDVTNPRTVHLVRNIGYAHSITIDPVRPWLAYVSTADDKDVLEIVDVRSCLGAPATDCAPTVSRAVFDPTYMPGLADPKTKEDRTADGCHDVRVRGDRLYCAAIGSTLILDVSKLVRPDKTLSGTHLTAGPDACSVLDSDPLYAPGLKVTDCTAWTKEAFAERRAKPADVKLVSVVKHDESKPADQDIEVAHQADAIADGRIMIVTDERGGGLVGPGCPGGGITFYDIRNERRPVRMALPNGAPAIFRTEHNIPSPVSLNPSCTVHYGREFADENMLVFAWYTNGTRIIRYYPDFSKSPAVVRFEEVAAIAPLGWVFDAMGVQRNPADPGEVIVYATDFTRGLDVFGVKTPRLTRARAFASSPARDSASPRVRGGQAPRQLPGTGLADPTTIGLALLTLALIGRRYFTRTRI